MISGLSTRKKTGSVGLDITCDSIAATEVQNGVAVGRTAIVPLQPGVVKEGDLVNHEVLSDALKDLFARDPDRCCALRKVALSSAACSCR